MAIRFIPFGAWPADRPRTKVRKSSPTKRSSAQLMRELETEVSRIGGKNPSVEVAMTADELRRDGLMYAGKSPRDPGLILRFTDRSGRAIVMPSDRYQTVEGNLFALYKTLEALRAIDRHGVATSGEQYTGWAKLPSGDAAPAMTFDDAADIILGEAFPDMDEAERADAAGAMRLRAGEIVRAWIRGARAKAHPDSGGSDERFQRVQQAVAIVGAHHGVEL